jgi:ABC-2 type transport system ATP-binding protein
VLRARGLAKQYGNVHAVRGIDLDVEAGTIVGLVGNNGAGKTTTLKLLAGLVAPSAGDIELAGGDPQVPATRRAMGFLPEDSPLYDDQTPLQYLAFFARLYDMPKSDARRRAQDLLRRLRLDEPFWRRPIGQLSKGSARKVAIARALLHDPAVLLLDEPTSGLDPATQADLDAFLADLRARGKAILLSAHDMRQVEALCDRIILVHEGRVAAEGSLDELRAQYGGTTYHLTATLPFAGSSPDGASHTGAFPSLATAEAAMQAVRAQGGSILRLDTRSPGLEAILERVVRGP